MGHKIDQNEHRICRITTDTPCASEVAKALCRSLKETHEAMFWIRRSSNRSYDLFTDKQNVQTIALIQGE